MSANLLTSHLRSAHREPLPVSCRATLQFARRCPAVAFILCCESHPGVCELEQVSSKSSHILCLESATDSQWGLWIGFSFSLCLSFSIIKIGKKTGGAHIFWRESFTLVWKNFCVFLGLKPKFIIYYIITFYFSHFYDYFSLTGMWTFQIMRKTLLPGFEF